jgi:hypothetical protein
MTDQNYFVHSGYARREDDFYPTIDERCLTALLDTWNISGKIVDNCTREASGIVDGLVARKFDAKGADDAFSAFEADWIVTNPPYGRNIVDKIAQNAVDRLARDEVKGVAFLMRANWDMAARRSQLFEANLYAGQTRMRFRPWWSTDRKKQPIHNFVWHVWQKSEPGEPVIRYWPLAKI